MRRVLNAVGVRRSILFVSAVLMFALPLAAQTPPADPPPAVRGDWLALYATPAYVAHTRAAEFIEGHDHEHDIPGTDEHSHHRDTFFVGLGTRARIRPTAYVVAEYAPRLSGHNPGRDAWGVGIEKRTRGHVLQLNVGNSFATTFGQLARGGSRNEVYLGFNLSRKF